MSPSAIHQFVPTLHRFDAVGRHTLRLRDVLHQRGVTSNIYVEKIVPDTETETRLYTSYDHDAQRGDLLLYQFAAASELAPWLAARRETLVLSYHHVAPPEAYAAWNNPMARQQLRALQELMRLAPRTALAVTASRFSETQLRELGYARTAVIPPAAMAPTETAGAAATATVTATGHRRNDWLAVGRVTPSKGIELALMGLLVTHAHYDPAARLQVIGQPVVTAYSKALLRFADELGLGHAVTFSGRVSDENLLAAMAGAGVLVAPSQHEGFGAPVIEAMAMGLPVVANNAGALPETVGEAGLLVDVRDPYATAAAVEELRQSPDLRRTLNARARVRVQQLDLPSAADRIVDELATL